MKNNIASNGEKTVVLQVYVCDLENKRKTTKLCLKRWTIQ